MNMNPCFVILSIRRKLRMGKCTYKQYVTKSTPLSIKIHWKWRIFQHYFKRHWCNFDVNVDEIYMTTVQDTRKHYLWKATTQKKKKIKTERSKWVSVSLFSCNICLMSWVYIKGLIVNWQDNYFDDVQVSSWKAKYLIMIVIIKIIKRLISKWVLSSSQWQLTMYNNNY